VCFWDFRELGVVVTGGIDGAEDHAGWSVAVHA
jgi:hypothetical protein